MHTQHYVKRYILVLFIPYKRQGHKNRSELPPELHPGSLVVVSLRDSANAPRRLAVVKGPAAGRGGHVLLEMGQEMHVAVRRESICCVHACVMWVWVLCACDY
jgi:hypothetical protein